MLKYLGIHPMWLQHLCLSADTATSTSNPDHHYRHFDAGWAQMWLLICSQHVEVCQDSSNVWLQHLCLSTLERCRWMHMSCSFSLQSIPHGFVLNLCALRKFHRRICPIVPSRIKQTNIWRGLDGCTFLSRFSRQTNPHGFELSLRALRTFHKRTCPIVPSRNIKHIN